MKKLFVFIICAVLICATPIITYAESADTEAVTMEAETTTVETSVEETPTIETTVVETPSVETSVVETPAKETSIEEWLTTGNIVEYVKEHFEEISVIGSLIIAALYDVRKRRLLSNSVATLNNNAITVSQNSESVIGVALAQIESVTATMNASKEEFAALLAEFRKEHEEKQKLEKMLYAVDNHLKTAKLANVELGNEVAELLVLANIPNSKKEELYSRHRAAVDAIESVPEIDMTEVKEDDGKETQSAILGA